MIHNDNDMVMVYCNCIVIVIVMILIEIVIKSITFLCTTIERHEAARSHLQVQVHFQDWQMVKIGKQNNQLLAWTCERVIEVNLPLTLRQSCVSV